MSWTLLQSRGRSLYYDRSRIEDHSMPDQTRTAVIRAPDQCFADMQRLSLMTEPVVRLTHVRDSQSRESPNQCKRGAEAALHDGFGSG
jgi:hypothetical protein